MAPERCSFKINAKSMNNWVSTHVKQIDQFEDVNSPLIIIRDEAMEEEERDEDMGREDHHTR